jgi:hypothetical protein
MTTIKRLVTIGSLSVLVLFGIFVVSTPFLREPPVPVVNVTIEPQPPSSHEQSSRDHDETTKNPSGETTEEGGTATTPAYQTGERTGEKLTELWTETKDFGRGLWSAMTE